LRIHKLQLVAAPEHQVGPRFWTHANPVEAGWRLLRSIRLDGDLEVECVQRLDRPGIELQQRLAACTNDKTPIP